MLKGIDVSVWQGSIDWSKVKNEVDFAILRAGYGRDVSQKDDRFEEYYAGCKANGIPIGAYWFSYATTAEDAVREAKACIECLKGKQFEYPILFDVEHETQCSTAVASAIIPAFCNTLTEAGYYVGIYTYYSFINNYIPKSIWKDYDIAIAHYASSTPFEPKAFWQYTEKGKVNGISGSVDLDYCYIDNYEEKIKTLGMNNLTKPVEEQTKPVTPNNGYLVDTSKPIPENKVTTLNYNDNTQISKHFNAQEFKCKCGRNHEIKLNYSLIWQLEKIMDIVGGSITIINSGYRCPQHDKNVGGSGVGQHVNGNAADCVFYDENKQVIDTKRLSCIAQDLGLGGIANITSSYTAIHLDVRTGYRWLGNEVVNNNTVTDDFYKYYRLTKDQVYPKKKEEEPKPTEPVKPEEPISSITANEDIKAGDEVVLNNTPLYVSSTAKTSSNKTGTYYVYSNEVINGRIRITNTPDRVGKKPAGSNVSGWLDVSELKKETSSEDKLAMGAKVELSNAPMYSSAYTKSITKYIAGTYYIYDGEVINNRLRITNSKENVNAKPLSSKVTGFVEIKDILK